jgi:hypothetical protein
LNISKCFIIEKGGIVILETLVQLNLNRRQQGILKLSTELKQDQSARNLSMHHITATELNRIPCCLMEAEEPEKKQKRDKSGSWNGNPEC